MMIVVKTIIKSYVKNYILHIFYGLCTTNIVN